MAQDIQNAIHVDEPAIAVALGKGKGKGRVEEFLDAIEPRIFTVHTEPVEEEEEEDEEEAFSGFDRFRDDAWTMPSSVGPALSVFVVTRHRRLRHPARLLLQQSAL